MEIIYRIYEKNTEEGWFSDNNKILQQEVCQCESREHFKQIMKDMYGDKLAFKNSNKLEKGDIFITIISENCYNSPSYLQVFKYKCDECGNEYLANGYGRKYFLSESSIKRESPAYYQNNEEELKNKQFCCVECLKKFEERHIKKAIEFRQKNDDVEDIFISKDNYASCGDGYIYMITKKSTGQFYVGQSKYVPIFRWGQHLLTDRFKLDNIIDYKFEVLEIVKNPSRDLNAKEAYWINKKRNENPSLSLNIVIPKEKQPNLFDLIEE